MIKELAASTYFPRFRKQHAAFPFELGDAILVQPSYHDWKALLDLIFPGSCTFSKIHL